MTTTLTKQNDSCSRMSFFTGMESLGVEIVSVFFFVIINITTLSSQTVTIHSGKNYFQKQKIVNVAVKPVSYTLYAARVFPVIECSAVNILHKIDYSEYFDYDAIFSRKITETKVLSAKKN